MNFFGQKSGFKFSSEEKKDNNQLEFIQKLQFLRKILI